MTLFGIDIAKEVADALTGAGGLRPGNLIKRDGTEAEFQGFVENRTIRSSDGRVEDALVFAAKPVLSIVAGTVADGLVPDVNDAAEMDGVTYELVSLVRRDPAAAVYEFEVR